MNASIQPIVPIESIELAFQIHGGTDDTDDTDGIEEIECAANQRIRNQPINRATHNKHPFKVYKGCITGRIRGDRPRREFIDNPRPLTHKERIEAWASQLAPVIEQIRAPVIEGGDLIAAEEPTEENTKASDEDG